MSRLDALDEYFAFLQTFPENPVAIDVAHNLFLIGALVARKPERVLELGIGSAYVTRSLLAGLRYNRRGTLTAVDNFLDWKGVEPPYVADLRAAGAEVIAPMTEKEFVFAAPTDAYDFLVSDADHSRSGTWVDEHLRIVRDDGFMFFHDTNHETKYKSLRLIEKRIRELGLPYYHFTRNSRPDERCDRGWLFAINRKSTDSTPAPRRSLWARLIGRP
jgi:predicted O-methyltransferase YrrM